VVVLDGIRTTSAGVQNMRPDGPTQRQDLTHPHPQEEGEMFDESATQLELILNDMIEQAVAPIEETFNHHLAAIGPRIAGKSRAEGIASLISASA
jgi:hypothetical protein